MRRDNLGNALKLEDVPTKENRDRVQRGFLIGWRAVIGSSGCFLDGAYGGHLLSVIGRDVNDNMLLIVFFVH